MKNYICINGKKTELTEEQLRQLGIEVKKERNNPFNRVSDGEFYYYGYIDNTVNKAVGTKTTFEDDIQFNNYNYFNDRDFAEQVMLHQLLYRKLLKYSYDNNAEDVEWNWIDSSCSGNRHYYIYQKPSTGEFYTDCAQVSKRLGDVYFSNEEVAIKVIKDVVEPFMKEHPNFIW